MLRSTNNAFQRVVRTENRTGAIAIVNVFLFVAMVLFGAWVINIVYIQRQQTQGQIAADLAARYGIDMLSRTNDQDEIEAEVTALAKANWSIGRDGGDGTEVDVNVSFGNITYSNGAPVFNSNAVPVNAVQVSLEKPTGMAAFGTPANNSILLGKAATAAALERDLCVVLDRSGSMKADSNNSYYYPYDPYTTNPMTYDSYWSSYSYYWYYYYAHPTKSLWSDAVDATQGLIDEINDTEQNEYLSLVTYGSSGTWSRPNQSVVWQNFSYNDSDIEVGLTSDYASCITRLNSLTSDKPLEGMTNIAAGIDSGVDALVNGANTRPYAYKTLIVLTDGNANRGREPADAAADAYAQGVQVHTVTFGTGANQADMIAAADAGGGNHYHAPDGDALEDIFRELANLPAAAIVK